MKLELDDNMKIEDVQNLFHFLFPFLKIEFFERDIRIQENHALRKHIGNGSRLLGEFRPRKTLSMVAIASDMTANELELSFNNVYALHIQVFRKSGNVWLEPTVTEGWTLQEQNKQGEILATQIRDTKRSSY